MYKRYDKLTTEEFESLVALSKEVTFKEAKGSRVRVGANAPEIMSVYNYSKWFTWKAKQRDLFKTFFPAQAIEKATQGWFLEIPENKGFLDTMTYWVGKPTSGRVIATALKTQSIIIDDESVRVKKGDQIGFSLESVHSIKPSAEGQLWACVMIRGCYNKVSD